jgi:hypothetical protein
MDTLEEDKIFEELMTSDFHDKLDNGEWKSKMLSFRKYYKILYSKYTRLKDDNEILEQSNNELKLDTSKRISKSDLIIRELENEILKLNSRNKLTLWERLTGKLNNDI